MEKEILLPQVGESVTEGTITKWLVSVGTQVEKFDPLAEVVTDKVTLEVPSPESGTITSIVANTGQTIPMGSIIAKIEPIESTSQITKIETQPDVIERTGVLLNNVRPVGPTGSGDLLEFESESPIIQPQILDSGILEEMPSLTKTSRYSPVVRQIATQSGVDLSKITGTGINGRVTKEDVLAHLRQGTQSLGSKKLEANPKNISAEGNEPLTPIRRIIAKNMEISARTIPQAWSMVEVDISDLVAFRNSIKEVFFLREGIRLTYLPFIAKILIRTLGEFPLLNSSWGEDRIILKNSVHLGIATDTPLGLMVPVLHQTEGLGVTEIAHSIHSMVNRARENELTLDEVQGGTFTLNNTGVLGSITSQPLINPPQAAILTTETIVKRAVVMPNEAIAIRSVMNLCMSFDHRILDGGQAGAFLRSMKEQLETLNDETRNIYVMLNHPNS